MTNEVAGEIRRSRPRLRLLLFIARRSLFANRLTVVLLALAIVAGVGFQIPNGANLAGFSDALLEEGLTRGDGDIHVEPRNKAVFTHGSAVAERMRAVAGVRSASPTLVYAGAVGVRGRFLGAPIYGIDTEGDQPFHLVAGTALTRGESGGLLLGTSLAKKLRVAVGDDVELRIILGAPDPLLGEDNVGRYTMKVRALVNGSSGAHRFVYVDRGFAGAEAGTPGAASAIAVHLSDHFAATAIAARINASSPDVEATGWREDDPYLKNYLRANETVNTVSYAMVIAAVAIPMWALIYIHVLRRRREIGILGALGFGRGEIFAIYVLLTLIVALIGCALGALAGYGLIVYFQGHPLFEWETMIVRPLVTVRAFAIPALVIVTTALLAGSYPAWSAARTDPAKVLRRIE